MKGHSKNMEISFLDKRADSLITQVNKYRADSHTLHWRLSKWIICN